MKTNQRGVATKRSGAKRESARSVPSAFRAERSSGTRRAGTARQKERSITLWKGVIANRKVRDLNLHLQGLYAELGKAVFELQGKKQSAVSKRSGELAELFGKIAEMRKNKSKIEEMDWARSKTVEGKEHGRSHPRY